MTAIELLTHKLRKATVGELHWLSKVYKCESVEFVYTKSLGHTERTTLATLAARPWEKICFGHECKVGFWGGPPGYEGFYFGTFVTFMVDRILQACIHEDVGFAWLLSFDSGKTTSMSLQIGHLWPDRLKQKTFWGPEEGTDCLTQKTFWGPEKGTDCPFDNPIVDQVQIGNNIYPIHEDGSQGCVVQRVGKAIPIRAVSAATSIDDGAVYPWSSSGRV